MTEERQDPDQKFLLFLGCAVPYRETSYEISTRKVLQGLGIELVEMPEYNCCGLPLDPVNHEMMLLLAARNLCLAEKKKLNVIALCPGCAGTLRKVNKKLKENKELRENINGQLKKTGLEFRGTIEVKHLLQMLAEDVTLEKIKAAITKPLRSFPVATSLDRLERLALTTLKTRKYSRALSKPLAPAMWSTQTRQHVVGLQ